MLRKINDRGAYINFKSKYDCRDYFRACRHRYKDSRHKVKFSEKVYREVLIDCFMQIFDKMMRYIVVELPYSIGQVYIEDVKCGFQKYKNGVILKRDLVDWPKTRALWKEDQDFQRRRIYVYQDLSHYARFRYKTNRKKFIDGKYYDLNLANELKDYIYRELTHKGAI